MAKRRGTPDRRGMGAQSDFIAEQFVPSERYKAHQKAMAESLAAMGLKPGELTTPSVIPAVTLQIPKPKPR